ncbi:MAG: hypothetical protein WC796_02730 [Candidatus Pacearchaeota archaeon]|jgi:hypothetical protein
MNKWLEIIIGLVLVLVAIAVAFKFSFLPDYLKSFGDATWLVLKGGIVWVVFFLGLLFLMLGISDLKN